MVSAVVVTCRTNQLTVVPAVYLTLCIYHFVERLLTDSLSLPQAPWSLTFWLVYEEIRVLAGIGNF